MHKLLKSSPDFKIQKNMEEYVESRGHICMYYPKFHCELNPIERVWCQSKNTLELTQMELSENCEKPAGLTLLLLTKLKNSLSLVDNMKKLIGKGDRKRGRRESESI